MSVCSRGLARTSLSHAFFEDKLLIMQLTLSLSFLPVLVSAHGFVQQIWFGDSLVDTWNPYKDPQKDPPVNKITRKFLDNGPVTDGLFTVRCST